MVLLALLLGLGLGRCTAPSGSQSGTATASAEAAGPAAPEVWTCSMHPRIRQPDPGDCPICAMDLIPLSDAEDGGDDDPRALSMSEASMALAEIQTTEVQRTFPEVEVRLVGKLEYDETRLKNLTARFPARIEQLYVNYTGVPVNQGEHLAKVYSPQLLTAQRELLTAHSTNPDSSVTRAARDKLLLWDLLPNQVQEIIDRGEAQDNFVLKAPIGGVVVSKNVKEGDYVETGDALFKIADLKELWLFLNAYETDLAWLRYGQDVEFSVEAYPGEIFHGRIAFIEPEVDRRTRTVSVRVNVPNDDERLKPGMFARGLVRAKVGQQGAVFEPEFAGKWISPMHPEIVKDEPGQCDVCGMDLVPAEELGYVQDVEAEAALTVPASAVLRTGKRSVVYVRKPDAEKPTFVGREIVLGPRAGDQFVVRKGLEEGDRVVSNGAFKIDSALQIQAKPSMMNPEEQEPEQELPEIDPQMLPELLPGYFAMQTALAADDLDAAKGSAQRLMEITGHEGDLADLIHQMLAASSLADFRLPHFEILSNALIATAKAHPEALPRDLLLVRCPMVDDDRGADWLQVTDNIRNPYFGAEMLTCGGIEEKLVATDPSNGPHEH